MAAALEADLTQRRSGTLDGTAEGRILGTPAYMSPEQARGQAVDKRTDIWAFGCVLFEMLTGRRAFDGDTMTDTLVAHPGARPGWAALPAETPASIRRLLERCLRKDPRKRLHDIADALIELDEDPEPIATGAARQATRRQRPARIAGGSLGSRRHVPRWHLCDRRNRRTPAASLRAEREPNRSSPMMPPQRGHGFRCRSSPYALAPDGRTIAIIGDRKCAGETVDSA